MAKVIQPSTAGGTQTSIGNLVKSGSFKIQPPPQFSNPRPTSGQLWPRGTQTG